MKESKSEIDQERFKTIETLTGVKIDILMCRGKHIFALQMESIKIGKELSPPESMLFLTIELCRVEGKRKGGDFYLELLSEDFLKIQQVIGTNIEPFIK